MNTVTVNVFATCTALSMFVISGGVGAQELDARAVSAAPVGTTFAIAGVGKSEGAIVFDPALDVENVHADLDVMTAGFGRVFGLAGRQARVAVVLPYARGEILGEVGQVAQSVLLSGLVDPRIKLSLGLRGAPALTAAEFANAQRVTLVGASLTIVPPWGAYDANSLVNLGYNRWALKPEIGVSRPFGPWTLEGSLGAWLYSRNDEYFPGNSHKRQRPLTSAQAHVSYSWPTRVWLALDATWFAGGRTRVNGVPNPDEQDNSRFGVTLSLPAGARQSWKLTYSKGGTTIRGNDFDSLMLTWQFVKL